jgi:hypothetical protein
MVISNQGFLTYLITGRKCQHQFCWLCRANYRNGAVTHQPTCMYHNGRVPDPHAVPARRVGGQVPMAVRNPFVPQVHIPVPHHPQAQPPQAQFPVPYPLPAQPQQVQFPIPHHHLPAQQFHGQHPVPQYIPAQQFQGQQPVPQHLLVPQFYPPVNMAGNHGGYGQFLGEAGPNAIQQRAWEPQQFQPPAQQIPQAPMPEPWNAYWEQLPPQYGGGVPPIPQPPVGVHGHPPYPFPQAQMPPVLPAPALQGEQQRRVALRQRLLQRRQQQLQTNRLNQAGGEAVNQAVPQDQSLQSMQNHRQALERIDNAIDRLSHRRREPQPGQSGAATGAPIDLTQYSPQGPSGSRGLAAAGRPRAGGERALPFRGDRVVIDLVSSDDEDGDNE